MYMCIWINIYVYVHKHKILIVSCSALSALCWWHISKHIGFWLTTCQPFIVVGGFCVSKLKVTALSSKSLNILLFHISYLDYIDLKWRHVVWVRHCTSFCFMWISAGLAASFPLCLCPPTTQASHVWICVWSPSCAACPCRLMIASLIFCGSPSTVILQGCQKLDF